ncbi:hypothetical protein [Alicyclobacillus fastidiosus]|uniref:Uncharacterized protein n=1 Tax=Alicyclobacillus fastidiosus TaxID=392011 RepID=A0ABV5A9M2_9BACL|nr:hypothetical protein [Alicyclobacillus fastidiosus]WEH10887.1 hypothetical protein PYS47_06630 [Alicyclobacillus fastidiosus]
MTSVVLISIMMALGAAQYHWNPYELFAYGNGFILGALLIGLVGLVFEIAIEINFRSNKARVYDKRSRKQKR